MDDGKDAAAANEDMTPAMRLMTLQGQHRALDQKIQNLQMQPYHNQLLIQRLKKKSCGCAT